MYASKHKTIHQRIENPFLKLKKLARVIVIDSGLHLITPRRHFVPTNMVRTLVQESLRMRKRNTNKAVPLDAMPNDVPRGSDLVIVFWVSQGSDTCL